MGLACFIISISQIKVDQETQLRDAEAKEVVTGEEIWQAKRI